MQNHTILIVDDTPANVGMLANYLKSRDFRVVVAQDGEEGLERAEFVLPDLILLDVMMPGINGFETCRCLKASTTTKDIPVIFMTALTDISSMLIGFEVGGVDYIIKPIQVDELFARIKTHLTLRKMQKQLLEQNNLLKQEVEVRLQAEAAQQLLIKRLQEAHDQLLQSEKMASIGQLAAGVAHEINNPIGFVNSNMTSLQTYVETLFNVLSRYEHTISLFPESADILKQIVQLRNEAEIDFLKEDVTEVFKESREGLKRVIDIVQSLKDFSHVGTVDWHEADLHSGIDNTLKIANNEIKYKACVIKEYGNLPTVMCLSSQLNQVFMNLLVNAAHAIEEFGVITIRTGYENDWVWIAISDTGIGIPPENLNHIFNPFFTTKPVGKGTGLGLSLSYSIIKKHGGRIEADSEVGKGTCFTLHLPIKGPSDILE